MMGGRKLKPALQKSVGYGIEGRVVIGGAENICIGRHDFITQGGQVVLHLADVVLDASKAGNTA